MSSHARSVLGVAVLSIGLSLAAVPAAARSGPLHLDYDTNPGTVAAQTGATRFTLPSPKPPVTAEMTMRRATPAENAPDHVTACAGGWEQCSLVDRLTITIDGHEVHVPRRAILMLSNVNRGQLIRLSPASYELDLSGGDAAASYEARLFFDRKMVRRLDIWAGEAQMLDESIVFHDLSHAFR